jgi:hypothetical protein
MRIKIHALLGLFLLFSSVLPASSPISNQDLKNHIKYLCSDALEGRLTGTKGEKLATQYIGDTFLKLGLEPAGDNGTFFQEFNLVSGVSLGKNNSLSITNQTGAKKCLKLNQEWRPLAFSDNSHFKNADLVLVSDGLNIKDKWVAFELSHQPSSNSSLRYKAFTAKEHGAKGIIFISDELIPLSFDTSLSGSGIVAISVKKSALNNLSNDDIKITGQTDINKIIQHGRNVLAKLRIDTNTSQMIVVGAHVDHLGHGELSGSRACDGEAGMIHSGADDNASGVASILEVAAKLSELNTQGKLHGNKNILFAAWSGEEVGALGSSHFVNNFTKTSANKSLRPGIAAAINLDMVGHLRNKLILQGLGSSPDWPILIKQSKVSRPIPIMTQSDPYLPTDSTSFYIHGVPTLNFFTGAHDDYHTPRDKPETLNYEGIKHISEFLVNLILVLENKRNLIAYREVKKPSDNLKRNFKIYLGTIPDYASTDVSGVKLSGVAKDSPANLAGLRQDDVITELAGKHIHDIYDYTFVLNALNVGEPVKIIVLRGRTKIALTVIPRQRR